MEKEEDVIPKPSPRSVAALVRERRRERCVEVDKRLLSEEFNFENAELRDSKSERCLSAMFDHDGNGVIVVADEIDLLAALDDSEDD